MIYIIPLKLVQFNSRRPWIMNSYCNNSLWSTIRTWQYKKLHNAWNISLRLVRRQIRRLLKIAYAISWALWKAFLSYSGILRMFYPENNELNFWTNHRMFYLQNTTLPDTRDYGVDFAKVTQLNLQFVKTCWGQKQFCADCAADSDRLTNGALGTWLPASGRKATLNLCGGK